VEQVLYDRRGVVSKENFPFVYWEGMKRVLKLFPEMFWVWVIKHVSHFQGTNRQLSRIDKPVLNVCPSCKCHDKSISHITWCPNPGCARKLNDLVGQLVQWLYDQQTNSEVVHLFKRYLLAGGTYTLTLLLKPNSILGVEARYLGWESCQHVGDMSVRQPNVGTFGRHPPVVVTQNQSRHSIFVSGIAVIHPICILVPELHTKNSFVRFVRNIWLLYLFRRYFLAPLNA
jgi:hypothetical protein